MDNGWQISNKGVLVSLKNGQIKLIFDKIFRTDYGLVLGIDMHPIGINAFVSFNAGTSMGINKFLKLLAHLQMRKHLETQQKVMGLNSTAKWNPATPVQWRKQKKRKITKLVKQSQHKKGKDCL